MRTHIPFSVTLSIPKTHPKLPALLQAAARLPDISMSNNDGLRVHKQNLVIPEAIETFLDILRSIVGNEMADAIEEQIGYRKQSPVISTSDILGVVRMAQSLLPIPGLAQAMENLPVAELLDKKLTGR